ncbi:MAG: hypothetical protein COT81_04675 [Candidatus Buchananbacteria bacterium CG10_big_fil_rev_8_21_14_0_10_42_9]|uniref:DegT/DnrJ/EryC1/StrS family aminotransferase n=1 Tax=Candidatus Buchananbacteria bacterium CG10_big_fil_rev_8_21_14_0_10_42_9 TaxID=1974526 RepID=A0A2H0W0C6_9BACT|nr:MAG: hypothetical protein COT81_04675 [Candidatus Buchananbacteria bacterium CG10_big_fil_rev_8_21_14_0_10_42_9]
MPVNKSQLGVGSLEISPLAKRYINQVLSSKRLSYGPFIQRFERQFSQAHGAKFGVMVNSGTGALRIAVACLKEVEKWQDGDEVICPAITFVATANVIVDHNLKPVFVDVDSQTYNIDPDKIEAKITKHTKAIMAVHLFGQPAAMDKILKIASKYKLKVIEDSAETMYAKYQGKRVGSFGDIACFSTYVAHLIVTGVGGLALTSNKKYAEVLRSLANHGRDNIYISIDDDEGKFGRDLQEVISRRFNFVRPGYSFRVTELEGALGCAQLKTINKTIATRRKNASYLISCLKDLEKDLQLPIRAKGAEHSFMIFPIAIKKGSRANKQSLVYALEKKGIETRDMFPLITQPFYKKTYKLKENNFPVAKWINSNGFYIGCHQGMRKAELDYIVKTVKDYIAKL